MHFQSILRRSLQYDMIYFLGDLPTHHVWNQSKGDMLYLYKDFAGLVRKHLPNVKFFPVLGALLPSAFNFTDYRLSIAFNFDI